VNEAIALGLGDNVDYEIKWSSEIIASMIRSYGISTRDLRPIQHIDTQRDLLVSILGCIKNGTGIERHVEDLRIITEFAGNFERETTIGGTAPRAAIALSNIGIPSSVHLVTINDQVRKLLPTDGSWYCSNTMDSSFPHLIVQYEKGARVTSGDIDIVAPVSTRLIYVNDHDNGAMRLEPAFFDNARQARVCLISGFNAMHDRGLLQERLRQLASLLRTFPESVTVFYEDACFHNAEFRRLVLDGLASLLDVFSLNEDELQGYLQEKTVLLDPRKMLESLRALHAAIPVPVLVVHARHWALASGEGCGSFATALRHGIALAATRFKFGDRFSKADFRRTHDLPAERTGAAFSQEINRLAGGTVCCLPSFEVEQDNVTTVGLGDAFVGGFLSKYADAQI
jgi:ADP-dependent phosphofructokinase/glucokinase